MAPILFGGSLPSAPIIIPITVIVVVAVAVILLIFHLLRKLVTCPHHKSKYPFHDQDPAKIKSTLPTSPYTIDPSSSASSNSIYFVKGSTAAGGLLYPALASAPSRTPSTGRRGPDDSFDRSQQDFDQDTGLDQVDGNGGDQLEEIVLVETSSSQSHLSPESHQLIPRASSALTGSTPSPTPYEVEERTTYRQEMSYQRSERQEFITTFPAAGGSSDGHYESDV